MYKVPLIVSNISYAIFLFSFVSILMNLTTAFASVNLIPYQNAVLGIKMNYPSDWNPEDSIDESGGYINFEVPGDVFGEFTIDVIDLPSSDASSLREYAFGQIGDLDEEGIGIADYVGTPTSTTLDGIPAIEARYTWGTENGGSEYEGRQINTVKGNKGVTVEYDILSEEYSKYEPIVRQMLDSIRIAN